MIFYDGNLNKKQKSNQGLLDDFTDRENKKENEELFLRVNAPDTINLFVGASVDIKVFFNGDDLTMKADNDNIIKVGNIILG